MKKIKSYSLGQLRGAWGAGRAIAFKDKENPLIGMCFLSFKENGELKEQGVVTKKINDEQYLILNLSWWDGCPIGQRMAQTAEMKAWKFFETGKEMRMMIHQINRDSPEDIEAEEKLIKFMGGE